MHTKSLEEEKNFIKILHCRRRESIITLIREKQKK